MEAQPGVDAVWAGDITYIPTREGWLYLAVIFDLASRRVVGWAVRTRLDRELALGALRMGVPSVGRPANYRPPPIASLNTAPVSPDAVNSRWGYFRYDSISV